MYALAKEGRSRCGVALVEAAGAMPSKKPLTTVER